MLFFVMHTKLDQTSLSWLQPIWTAVIKHAKCLVENSIVVFVLSKMLRQLLELKSCVVSEKFRDLIKFLCFVSHQKSKWCCSRSWPSYTRQAWWSKDNTHLDWGLNLWSRLNIFITTRWMNLHVQAHSNHEMTPRVCFNFFYNLRLHHHGKIRINLI